VVAYNLWMNDDGLLELDFEDDDEVICSYNTLFKHSPLRIVIFLGHINPIVKEKWCIVYMNNDFPYNSCANYSRKEK
jgi:hypothetical protein